MGEWGRKGAAVIIKPGAWRGRRVVAIVAKAMRGRMWKLGLRQEMGLMGRVLM